jgi:adenylate cyclase
MATIRILPDDVLIESAPGETLLDVSLRGGVAHAHACGGHARCSTCRVEVTDGIDACAPRTPAEQSLAERLGFAPQLRLACQTTANDSVTVRRLILDDDDVALTDQRGRDTDAFVVGEERTLAILFADIREFTAFSEQLPAHDVVHALNRYFHAMGREVARFGGCIDNYMGDGFMALFGLGESELQTESSAALDAVQAGLAMLKTMDALKPYLETAYGQTFDMRIGIHFGEAVVGSVGATGRERVTAIGDAVNFASRIESANKQAGTRLLISEALYARVGPQFRIGRGLHIPIHGKSGEYALYEVLGAA